MRIYKRSSHVPSVKRQRLYLALTANCRAGGTRRFCMKMLAEKVGVFRDLPTLESDLLFYAADLHDPSTVTRLLKWSLHVAKANEPLSLPICIPQQQLALAA